jgi:hypothetical protein
LTKNLKKAPDIMGTRKSKKVMFYRMTFYPPKTEKQKVELKNRVISLVNGMKVPYYYNLPNGGYEIQFIGEEDIIQDDLVSEKIGEDTGEIRVISKGYY